MSTFYDKMAAAMGNPSRVRCTKCGRVEAVKDAACLRDGWPRCCGYTMRLVAVERGAQ